MKHVKNSECSPGNIYAVFDADSHRFYSMVEYKVIYPDVEHDNVFQGVDLEPTGVEHDPWFLDDVNNDGYAVYWDIYEVDVRTEKDLKQKYPEYFL